MITGVPFTAVQDVLFGGKSATVASTGSGGITVTVPPGSPGPVDVAVNATDGSYLLSPQDYTYGPFITEIQTGTSTAEGGGTGTVYGYGFGTPVQAGTAPGLQLSIGNQSAGITQYLPQPFANDTPYYPFPLESFVFTIPPGIAGTKADVTVENAQGSMTVTKGLEYLPSTQQYPLAGAILAQGIYDSARDLYYFTDATKVQVFSKTKGQWLTPFSMPAGAKRLWGLSLSPDGSELAVSDAGGNQIFTLSPDTPASAKTFPLPTAGFDAGENPCGLAITDSGIVYYAAFSTSSTGSWAFHKLNTSTGVVHDYQELQNGDLSDDVYIKLYLSNDNSRVFANIAGTTFTIDTASDTFSFNPVLQGFDYELAVSSNQTWMTSGEYLLDTNLNPQSSVVYVDRDIWNQSAVYGEKISADGNLLFAPLVDAIDVIDGRNGVLRTRVALPFTLSSTYDALVADGKDNVLVAIISDTGTGIAVVDLSSLPESTPQALAISNYSSQLRKAEWTAATQNKKSSTAHKLDAMHAPRGPRHILSRNVLLTPF